MGHQNVKRYMGSALDVRIDGTIWLNVREGKIHW
jgi:hypothetical protein